MNKLYYNVKKNILWVINNGEIVDKTIIGKCNDKILKEYCNKAYSISNFTKINSLADIL